MQNTLPVLNNQFVYTFHIFSIICPKIDFANDIHKRNLLKIYCFDTFLDIRLCFCMANPYHFLIYRHSSLV